MKVKPLRVAVDKSIAKASDVLVLFRWKDPTYFLSDYESEFINKTLAEP